MASTTKTAKPVTFTVNADRPVHLQYEVEIVKGESIRIRCKLFDREEFTGQYTIACRKWSRGAGAILDSIYSQGKAFESKLASLLAAKEYGIAGDMLEEVGMDRELASSTSVVGYREVSRMVYRNQDITFYVGDIAEYDSYNLHYLGRITSITDKTVTIKDDDETRRLKIDEFCRRNYDGLERKIERNNDWTD